ncbi:Ancillary SecYEG translocon subunit [Gammaproteobacteria bacterium]
MDAYVTEEQQVEAIKKWWKENGVSVITGAALGLAIVFGVRAWNDWRAGKTESASELYQRVEIGLKADNSSIVEQVGKRLMDEYPTSIYATLGALAQAGIFMKKSDPASARGSLEWVITQGLDPRIKAIAQLRLGHLFLDQGDHARALTLSAAAALAGFQAEADELRGDALRLQGDQKGARSAYQSALAKLPANSGVVTALQLKLADLGEEP